MMKIHLGSDLVPTGRPFMPHSLYLAFSSIDPSSSELEIPLDICIPLSIATRVQLRAFSTELAFSQSPASFYKHRPSTCLLYH